MCGISKPCFFHSYSIDTFEPRIHLLLSRLYFGIRIFLQYLISLRFCHIRFIFAWGFYQSSDPTERKVIPDPRPHRARSLVVTSWPMVRTRPTRLLTQTTRTSTTKSITVRMDFRASILQTWTVQFRLHYSPSLPNLNNNNNNSINNWSPRCPRESLQSAWIPRFLRLVLLPLSLRLPETSLQLNSRPFTRPK